MAKFRKRPGAVEAVQWYVWGQGPKNVSGSPIVCRYGATSQSRICRQCGLHMDRHGWIDTLEGGHIVCPGDWIITGVAGEHFPCKDKVFRQTYEPVERKVE